MAEIKVRDQEKGSYYGLGFIYGMMEDSFLAFMMMSFGLCFIDIILVGVGAGASQIFNFGPSYFPSSQPTMAPFSVNITVTPSMEPTLGNSYHSFQRPFTYELQILVISASIITFLWGYFATVRFFPPDYKWKKAIGKRMRRVIDFMCCRKESSKIVPEEIDKEELKSNDPYLVYKKDTSHLASNTLHEVTVVPSYQVMLARMWMCLDKQCTLELFIYIFSIVFFAYGQYGLASLRVLRMYRYLTYFNYLEVDQDEDIPKERLQFSLVKAAKICGFYMDQLYYEFFTQKSMGGSLVMVLFFFNAYVMAVVMHIQKGYVLTGADFVTQPCVTLNMCFLTMIRLAVYDGSGLDFVAAILDEGSDGFVFMLMFYAVLNALILFNGLIGIFANTFTENDETADTTLGEIIELDANVRYFHEETKKKMNEMQNFLVDFVTKFEQINGNYGSGNGNDNHQHTGRSQVTAQHRGSGTYMHHSAAHIVTDGPSYRRNSRTNSVSTAKSRHNSDATEIFNPYSDKYVNSTDNSIRSQGSVTNPLIQSALTTSPRSGVDTHTESGMTQSDLNQSDLNQSEGDIAMINSSVQEADPPVKKLLSKLLPPLSVAPQQAPVPVPVPVVDKQQAIPVMSSVTSATTTATTNTKNKSSGSSSSGGVLSLDVSDSPGHKDGKKKLSLLNKLV